MLNKTDLDLVVSKEYLEEKTGHPVIAVSAREETGMKRAGKNGVMIFFAGKN